VKILLTGRNGQVGFELQRTLSAIAEVVATDRSTLDLADPDEIRAVLRQVEPDLIVNAAAYTAVDKAESEAELAMRINGVAPRTLAEEAKRRGILLIHFSTDYVFDGTKSAPYVEDDPAEPLNVYGCTKLAGEEAIRRSACPHLILRTSWVYSPARDNFMSKVLRLARDGKDLRIVNDQFGAPTSAAAIASATAEAITKAVTDPTLRGIYHLTAAGTTTWYGFAQTLLQRTGLQASLQEITSEELAAPARRPAYCVLDNRKMSRSFGIRLRKWDVELDDVLSRMQV
jgi:dTDP-4-dehydrorhamnose reductase